MRSVTATARRARREGEGSEMVRRWLVDETAMTDENEDENEKGRRP